MGNSQYNIITNYPAYYNIPNYTIYYYIFHQYFLESVVLSPIINLMLLFFDKKNQSILISFSNSL